MNTAFLLAAALVTAAAGKTPSAEQTPSIEAKVLEALQRNALDAFAGTVSFDRDSWDPASAFSPDTPESTRRRQHWTVTTDGRGSLRGTIKWSSGVTFNFGRIDGQRWILMNGDLLIQHADARSSDVAEESGLMVMDNFISNAESFLARILDPLAGDGLPDVLLIDRDPESPSTVIQVDDDVKQIDFTPIGDVLVPRTIVRSDERHSYRYNYSGFRPVDGRWVPTQVDLYQRNAVQPTRNLQARLSDIQVAAVADPASAELRSRLQISRVNESGEPVVVVALYTADGINYEMANGTKIEATQ